MFIALMKLIMIFKNVIKRNDVISCVNYISNKVKYLNSTVSKRYCHQAIFAMQQKMVRHLLEFSLICDLIDSILTFTSNIIMSRDVQSAFN